MADQLHTPPRVQLTAVHVGVAQGQLELAAGLFERLGYMQSTQDNPASAAIRMVGPLGQPVVYLHEQDTQEVVASGNMIEFVVEKAWAFAIKQARWLEFHGATANPDTDAMGATLTTNVIAVQLRFQGAA